MEWYGGFGSLTNSNLEYCTQNYLLLIIYKGINLTVLQKEMMTIYLPMLKVIRYNT